MAKRAAPTTKAAAKKAAAPAAKAAASTIPPSTSAADDKNDDGDSADHTDGVMTPEGLKGEAVTIAVETSALETADVSQPTEEQLGGAILANGDRISHDELVHAMRDPETIITTSTEGIRNVPGSSKEVTHLLRKLGPFEEPEPGDQVISADPLVVVRNERIDAVTVEVPVDA